MAKRLTHGVSWTAIGFLGNYAQPQMDETGWK